MLIDLHFVFEVFFNPFGKLSRDSQLLAKLPLALANLAEDCFGGNGILIIANGLLDDI